MKPFNDLSPAEAERLALLLEEAGEIVQICGKILRHGYESWNPDDRNKTSNRSLLEKEIGDLMAAVDLLVSEDDLEEILISRARTAKHKNVGKYLHHQKRKDS